MIKHMKGNLLDLAVDGHFDAIVQGCNCFNTMGGGIAREIRERYPHAADVDARTKRGDYRKLGSWTDTLAFDKLDQPFMIINAYTQYNMSTGEDVFEYAAFELILQKLLHEMGELHFGFPYIGMGLAGGDKVRIIGMLECFADGVTKKGGSVTLVEFA